MNVFPCYDFDLMWSLKLEENVMRKEFIGSVRAILEMHGNDEWHKYPKASVIPSIETSEGNENEYGLFMEETAIKDSYKAPVCRR